MGRSGKENSPKRQKVNGEINPKNTPKRQLAPTTKHRIGRFVKGEAQAHGYLGEGDNSFKKACLDSAEATNFVATGCYLMVILGKHIRITSDFLKRMKVFKHLSKWSFYDCCSSNKILECCPKSYKEYNLSSPTGS